MFALAPTNLSTFAASGLPLLCGAHRVWVALVDSLMLGIRDRYQVLWSIVQRVTVDVVNVLPRLKAAVVRLFPYETMFAHVAVAVSKVVACHPYQRIAVVNVLPASPLPGTLTTGVLMMPTSVELAPFSLRVARLPVRVSLRNPLSATTSTANPAYRDSPPCGCDESPARDARALGMARLVSRWFVAVMRLPLDRFAASTGADSHAALPSVGRNSTMKSEV